jgi:PAT family beta-lactamase induction signal transducer AmpG
MKHNRKSPWWWLPTTYMAEGLPYFAVNTIAVMMYARMGVSNSDMAFYTAWLYLPWVIKPFWSPFVDLIKTKRWWTITMQFLIAATMASAAFCINLPTFFATTLAAFWMMAFFSATHDIAADGYYMLALDDSDQAAYVGVRSTFYRIASVIGQGGLVILAGKMETATGDIPMAWSSVFIVLSLFFVAVSFYHLWAMPKEKTSGVENRQSVGDILKGFGDTFVTFFKKPHVASALAFMLLYRLPEAMMLKLVQPFFIADRSLGGLALTTEQVGFINGTVGVVALLLGGIVGGVCISRGGLKKWLWPMALSLTLPCAFYCYLAMAQPTDLLLINAGIFVEQFGYGFGFTAFMLYLIHFSEGEYKTAHYSFCTAFMALGMMLPGMAAGWIQEALNDVYILGSDGPQGYINFFWWVMICSIATFVVCTIVKIDPNFGKKKTVR